MTNKPRKKWIQFGLFDVCIDEEPYRVESPFEDTPENREYAQGVIHEYNKITETFDVLGIFPARRPANPNARDAL